MPKQFIPLFGRLSTFQRTMALLSEKTVFDRPIVVANVEYRFTAQHPFAGIDAELVLGPVRSDSAPAVAVATELALRRDPAAVVGVFAADHVVQDGPLFVSTCAKAAQVAAQGLIVTIGLPPSRPATGYGYIRPGVELAAGARTVDAFVEKPDAPRAAQYLLDGHLWNSGNFIFSGATMRAELEAFAPDVIGPAPEAVAGTASDLGFLSLDPAAFERPQKISIDYAVMERTAKAAVTPGGFGWSDVGGRSAAWELSPKDEAGNAVSGCGYVVGGSNNPIRAGHQVVGVIGLDNVAVIATRDAVLVTPQGARRRVQGDGLPVARARRIRGRRACRDSSPLWQISGARRGRALSGQAHHREAGRPPVLAEALSPRRTLGVGARRRRGDARRRNHRRSRERIDLSADRLRPPYGQSRQDSAGADRSAGRLLSGRRRNSAY
jgi:mannose-1-phosphate guanylyltransferase/mannose-6-phosphate isomerase